MSLWEWVRAYANVCARERAEREQPQRQVPPTRPQLHTPWLPVERRGPAPVLALDPIVPEPASTVFLRPALESLVATATHEAAHAVTACVLGVRVVRVEVGDDCSGTCAHYGALDVRARALITAAGLVAEDTMSFGSVEQEADEPDVVRLATLVPDAHARVVLRSAVRRFLSDDRVGAGLDVLASEILMRSEVDGARVEAIVEASNARAAVGKLLG